MAVSSFIPVIWSSFLLRGLETKLVSEAFVNHNYEGDARMGGSVKINIVGPVTINDYNGSLTYEALSTTAQELIINNKKSFSFSVDDVERIQTKDGGALMAAAMADASYRILKAKDTQIFNKLATEGTVLSDTINVYDADSAVNALLDIKQAMDTADIPDEDRAIAIDPIFEKWLLANKNLGLNPGIGGELVKNGKIGELFGLAIHRTNNLYKSGGLTYVVASTPRCTTVASQIEEIEALRSTTAFADDVRGLYVWGSKVIRPAGVIVAKISNTAPAAGGGGGGTG